MKPKLVFAPEAAQDLDEIFAHVLAANPAAATRLIDSIQTQLTDLREMPHRGRPGRVPGTRELVLVHTPFIAPYQVTGNVVQILRIYHGARLWPESF